MFEGVSATAMGNGIQLLKNNAVAATVLDHLSIVAAHSFVCLIQTLQRFLHCTNKESHYIALEAGQVRLKEAYGAARVAAASQLVRYFLQCVEAPKVMLPKCSGT